MTRWVNDIGIRVALGREAGRRAYVALSFRAVGVSMWIAAGLWAAVMVGMSLQLGLGEDERGWLFSTSWWVCAAFVPGLAVIGALGTRLFYVWERKALGERYGELRLEPRPDPS